MKKWFGAALLGVFAGCFCAFNAQADIISENFSWTSGIRVQEEYYANFNFNLSGTNQKSYIDRLDRLGTTDYDNRTLFSPTTEVTNFVPGEYDITSATLRFRLYSTEDNVTVSALLGGPNGTPLGTLYMPQENTHYTLEIDFSSYLAGLTNGQFSIFLYESNPNVKDNFDIFYTGLDINANLKDNAPVPVPPALALLLSGLGGLALFRRRMGMKG